MFSSGFGNGRVGVLAAVLCALVLGFASPIIPRAVAAERIVVFAAASLKNALDDVAAAWTRQTGQEVRISFAGSSRLARQIQQGAPADVYISANVRWMDVLEEGGLVDTSTRRDLLGNRIVLIAHGPSAPKIEVGKGFDLAGLLGDGRLAMAMVDAVPAGIYGKAALISLGLWEEVAPKVAQVDNVRAALALVARGEAHYGVVYATDAAASANVTVIGTFPGDTHPPIIYPAAVTAESENKDLARTFMAFLASPQARPLFQEQGFVVLGSSAVN